MVVSNPREDFLEAASSYEDPKKVVHFVEKHVSKKDEFNLGEVFQSLSNKQHSQLWAGLLKMCGKALGRFKDAEAAGDQSGGESLKETLQCIDAVTEVLLVSIELETQVVSNNMAATLTILHGLLLDLPDDAEKLRQKITKVCQIWWVKELPGAESYAPNMILCILSRCSLPQATRNDSRDANSICKALNLIQWGDPSSADLELLLKQCLSNPIVLKYPEGRSFLGHLFTLNVSLIESLHSTVKINLPTCSKTMVEHYAEVYFKAWKQSIGDILTKIEEQCIQDFMYLAAHAGSKSLSSILRQLLNYFALQKMQQGVDKMLLRLYNPILWRALSAANAGVRANAASLLIDAFPLQDPDSNKEEMDATLQKQIDALQGLLDDPCPTVRAVGIQGVCRITGTFWELLPVQVVAVFLTKLTQELAYDSSSTDVRINVFKGLSFVLDNPMSHPLLKNLLPSLKDFIHDTSEKVITTFLDLLIKIKSLKTIKVFSIVSIEDLLARLEMDSPPVARRIIKLLFNSFHPSDQDPSTIIDRLITLIKSNKGACRVFYCYAPQHMPVAYAVDFLLLICHCIRGCIRDSKDHQMSVDGGGDTSSTPNDSNSSNESVANDEEKENEDDEGLSLKDVDVMEGMLEVAAIFWSGLSSELDKPINATLKQKLVAKYAKALPDFVATFQEGRSVQAILMLSTFLPASRIPSFSNGCLSTLKSLPSNTSPDTYSPLLMCLVSWGRGSHVLDMIINWFIPALQKKSSVDTDKSQDGCSTDEKNPKKKKRVAFIEPVEPRPDMGLKYIDVLLQHYPSCTRLLQTSAHKVVELAETLACAMGCIEKRFLGGSEVTSDDLLVQCLSMYTRLLIHLQTKFNVGEEVDPSGSASSFTLSDFTPQLRSLVSWVDQELISFLKPPQEEEETAPKERHLVKLAKQVTKNIVVFLGDAVLLSLADDEFKEEVSMFLQCVMQTEYSLFFMEPTIKLSIHLSNQIFTSNTSIEDVKVKDFVSPVLMAVIKALSKALSKMDDGKPDNEMQQTLSDLKAGFSECLKSCHSYQSVVPALDQEIMASVMMSMLADIGDHIRESGYVPVDAAEDSEDLPALSNFLLGVISSSQPLLSAFVLELQRCLSVGALERTSDMCAALNILCVLKKGGKKVGKIDECLAAAEKQLDLLSPNPSDEADEEDEAIKLERFWFTEAQKLYGIATGAVQPLPQITDFTPPKRRTAKRENASEPPLTSNSSEEDSVPEGPQTAPPLGALFAGFNPSMNSSGFKSKRKLYDGSTSMLL